MFIYRSSFLFACYGTLLWNFVSLLIALIEWDHINFWLIWMQHGISICYGTFCRKASWSIITMLVAPPLHLVCLPRPSQDSCLASHIQWPWDRDQPALCHSAQVRNLHANNPPRLWCNFSAPRLASSSWAQDKCRHAACALSLLVRNRSDILSSFYHSRHLLRPSIGCHFY